MVVCRLSLENVFVIVVFNSKVQVVCGGVHVVNKVIQFISDATFFSLPCIYSRLLHVT